MNSTTGTPYDDASILLGDSDKSALLQTRTQLISAGIRCLIEEASDAPGLILALSRRLRQDANSLPLVVLAEVNMRKTSGFDALKWIRGESSLAELPVIILSAGADESAVTTAFQLGADGYITKEKNLEGLTYIYQQACRVRAGKLPRIGAFASIPGGKRAGADEQVSFGPSRLSA